MRIPLFLLLLVLVGCESKPAPAPAGPKGPPGGMGPMGMGGGENIIDKLPGGPEFAAGKKVYADNNCARCHKLGETGGGPSFGGMGGPGGWKGGPPGGFAEGKKGPPGDIADGKKGPPPGGGMGGTDLTKVGADSKHTVAWLSAHIRDPKSHSPYSRMPASGPDKISDTDLKALAEYLASLK